MFSYTPVTPMNWFCMDQSSVDLCPLSQLHFWSLYFSYCCSKYLKTRLSGLNWVVKVTITSLSVPLPRTLYLRNASRKSLSHSRMDWLESWGQRFRSLSPQTCHQKIPFFELIKTRPCVDVSVARTFLGADFPSSQNYDTKLLGILGKPLIL